MENRISALESRQAGLRERIASMEAGLISWRAVQEEHRSRLADHAGRMDAISNHLTAVKHSADTRLIHLQIAVSEIEKKARNTRELRRWIITALVPTLGGIIVLIATGNIDWAKQFLAAGK